MSANMVVGPTKVKPLDLSAAASAVDSGERVGTSSIVRGVGVVLGWKDQTKSARPPSARSEIVARAFVMAARILALLRTISSFWSNLAMSRSEKAPTFSGSNWQNASRNAGRLRSMRAQDKPAWKVSKVSRSYMPQIGRVHV